MAFADTLSTQTRKRARASAMLSAIFGCVSEQAIDTNTLLILYLSMLGGGDSFSMFSTAVSAIACTFLSIPAAGLVDRLGLRRSYSLSIYIQVAFFLLIAAAPLAGSSACDIVMGAFAGFCVVRAFYAATWFPITDGFLCANERGSFFGTLRFCYMLFNMLLIFGVGRLMGEHPPIWIIQVYFAVAGLGLLGRKICLDRIPVNTDHKTSRYELLPALKISIHNGPLVGFSFYFGFLNMTAMCAAPLAIIYMKSGLNYGAATIMSITAIGLLGQIIGYALVGKIIRLWGICCFQCVTHGLLLLSIGLLIVVAPEPQDSNAKLLLFTSFFCNGVSLAFLACLGSVEMLALARPGNKIMAMAFTATFQYAGSALGRLGTTVLLATGMLNPDWSLAGTRLTNFHTIFIFDFILTLLGGILLLLTPALVPRHDDYYHP